MLLLTRQTTETVSSSDYTVTPIVIWRTTNEFSRPSERQISKL